MMNDMIYFVVFFFLSAEVLLGDLELALEEEEEEEQVLEDFERLEEEEEEDLDFSSFSFCF